VLANFGYQVDEDGDEFSQAPPGCDEPFRAAHA